MIVQWMVYASAVSALLAGAAWVLEAGLRPRRLATRWGWLAAMLLSLAIPGLRLARPAPVAEPFAMQMPAFTPAPAEPVSFEPVAAGATVLATAPAYREPLAERVEPLAPRLWLAASAALSLLLLVGWGQLAYRSRGWRRGSVDGHAVLLSADTGPAVIGVVRAAIVLPEWVMEMAPEERRLILQHERAHVSARDPLLVALGMATVLVTPWNAPLWWMLRRLRLAIETDCDARVLLRQARVGAYARLLLSLAERSAGSLPHGAPAFAEPRSFLERRIRAMTTPRPSRRRGFAAALLAAALVPALALSLPSPPPLRATPPAFVLPTAPVRANPAPTPTPPAPSGFVAVPMQGAAADTLQVRYQPGDVTVLAQREFPADMRERGIEGSVTLRFTVDRTGKARDPEAIAQSGLEFIEPAKRVVQQLQFQAARLGDAPVEQAVPHFRIDFRLRPPTVVPRGEPGGEEVLLRTAIQRYYPELFREEPARPPHVYLVVDERGNVLRHALSWNTPPRLTPQTFTERFPDLPRPPELAASRSITSVRTGIPGGRDVRVYWAVLRGAAAGGGPIAWGPYPLDAVAPPAHSLEWIRQALRRIHPDVFERASEETISMVANPRGEVVVTWRGPEGPIPPQAQAFLEPGSGVTVLGRERAADGGYTRFRWISASGLVPTDTSVIAGTVRDAAGNPVPGAVVLFRDRRAGTVSGSDGRYVLDAAGVPTGTHPIIVRHPAGAPAATRQVTFRAGSSASADLALPAR